MGKSKKKKVEKWIKHYCSSHKILLVGEGDFSFAVCLATAFGSANNIVATSYDTEAQDNCARILKKFKWHVTTRWRNSCKPQIKAPFSHWNLDELASESSLLLKKTVAFKIEDYPGYNNKRGDGSNEPFNLGKCSTYIFILSPFATSVRGLTPAGVDYLTAEDNHNAGLVLRTCARLIKDSLENDEGEQVCAFFLSIITLVLPGLKDDVMEAICQLGGEPTERVMPRDTEHTLIEMEVYAHPTWCDIAFTQALFLMFKNVTAFNYETFITRHIRALKFITGAMPSYEFKLFEVNKAIMICARVGACYAFKVAVLNEIVKESKQKTTFGEICAYILSILAWSDMSSLCFISEAFCLQNPVIHDARVLSEVRNLAIAYDTINRSKYPQFFRVLHSPLECRVLEKNRFSILASLATKIRSGDTAIVNQFVSNRPDDAPVYELYNIHMASRQLPSNAIKDIVDYLTNFDEDDYGY